MTDLSPAVVGRMVAFVRGLANVTNAGPYFIANTLETARELATELPEPVDPDVLEARCIAEDIGWFSANHLESLRAGREDNCAAIIGLIKAIKRGRALQQQENARG